MSPASPQSVAAGTLRDKVTRWPEDDSWQALRNAASGWPGRGAVTPKVVAPYGSWRSPITAELVASGGVRLGQIALDGDDVYWLELRPTEAGRAVLVRRTPDGGTEDVTPPEFNVRSRVHEYGGGSFAVSGRTVVFANFADGALYRQDRVPAPDRSDFAVVRTAAAHGDRPGCRRPACRHRHRPEARPRRLRPRRSHDGCVRGRQHGRRRAAGAMEREPGASTTLVAGNDFYSNPRLSPDGNRLAWLSWNHPNMPWDGCELWVGELRAERVGGASAELVAGGPDESIFQPSWSPDGILHFVSDRTGWWNLHRWNERAGVVEPLAPMEAEFGQPQWVFGLSTYAFLDAARILCTYTRARDLGAGDPRPAHRRADARPAAVHGVPAGSGASRSRHGRVPRRLTDARPPGRRAGRDDRGASDPATRVGHGRRSSDSSPNPSRSSSPRPAA